MSIETNGTSRPEDRGARRPALARIARAAGVLLLAALVSVACVESAPAGPVLPLIPGNSIAAIVVESPYKLFAACDGFWKAAKLDQLVGSGLEELLAKSIPNAGEAAQVLDFARPWAMAVLPSDDPNKPNAVLYVPFRSKPDAFVEKILGAGSSLKIVAQAKGYAVLAEGDAAPAFPTAKALDLKALSRYPAGSIKLWGDVDALATLAKDGYKPIEDAMRGFVTDPADGAGSGGAGALSDPEKALKSFADMGVSLLKQLKTADAALVLSADGFAIRAGATAVAGSELQKSLAKLGKAGSALDWAPQVDSEAFYGLSWAIDPAASADLSKQLMNPLLASLGLKKEAVNGILAYQDKWMKVSGARGAMSFDFSIDAAMIAKASGMGVDDPAIIADLVTKMMAFDVDAVMEVKNEAAYRALMKGYATDADLKAFMKAYEELFGIQMAFTSEDKKDGSFSYGDIGFSLKVTDPTKLGGATGELSESDKLAMDSILNAVSSMIRMRWAVSGGKCFITTGESAALKALTTRKAAEKSLAAEPSFAAFSKTIPQKPVLVLSMSMKKLMGMIGDISSGASGGSAQNPLAGLEGLGNWYGYLSADGSASLELGYFIPAADIGAIAQYAVMMSAQAKSGGDA